MLLRNTAGFETSFSPVFSYGANAGVVYSNAEIASVATPVVTGTVPAFAGGSTAGFIGDAHAIYRITKDTTLNLFASQTLGPAITGALTKRTTFHAGVTQIVDSRSSVSVAGDISRQTSSGTTNDFLSGSISYSYQLAREWNASVTYRYLYRTATTGGPLLDPITGLPVSSSAPAAANSLLVTVSNNHIVKPLDN
jgi:hypothetical protein